MTAPDPIEAAVSRSVPDLVLDVAAEILDLAGRTDGLATLRDPHLVRRYPGAVGLALLALVDRAGCFRAAIADLRGHAVTLRADRLRRAN